MSEEAVRAGADPAQEPVTYVREERRVADTETLMNELIAECREYVRLMGESMMAPEHEPHTRWKFLEMVVELVKTGAGVGDTVARLRNGGASETRQRIIVERRGEGGAQIPENE